MRLWRFHLAATEAKKRKGKSSGTAESGLPAAVQCTRREALLSKSAWKEPIWVTTELTMSCGVRVGS